MNSFGAAYEPSHENGGNQGTAPKETNKIQNLVLNNGTQIPMLGYGTGTARAPVRNAEKPLDKDLVRTVAMAIKLGFHHIDTAEAYFTEPEVGLAIKEAGIPREQLFVTTKTMAKPDEDISTALDESLKKLQLDHVDLYLIHAPYFAGSDTILQQKWAEMEAVYKSGRAKAIGVSSFLLPHLKAILATAKVVPAINQVEYHPYLQHPGLIEFHKEHNIATAAFGALSAVTKASPGPVDEMYAGLARKYGVTSSEIALRWNIDQGIVTLTTSGSEDRLKGYLSVAQFKLTPGEVSRMAEKGKEKHFRGFWDEKFAKDDIS